MLSFNVPNEQGEPQYYEFQVIPFALASATQCLARLTKPICAFLASKGIRHSLYIDDGKVNTRPSEMEEHLQCTLNTLKVAGFVVAPKKTDSARTAATKKEYLGFIIDSSDMKIRATSEKFSSFREALKK